MSEAFEQEVKELVRQISDYSVQEETKKDECSWKIAEIYVTGRTNITAKYPNVTPQTLNKCIINDEEYQGKKKVSFFSHSWRLYETWPEIFCINTKKLSFMMYKQIANSKVKDKDALRQWAEDTQPTQAQLRERIKELTGDDRLRIGFRLMTTNMWRFASSDGAKDNEFDGGIADDVVANLLHYFTLPGDVVIDPMAGSGRTGLLVNSLPYFSPDWQDEKAHDNGGSRNVLMSDISPANNEIIEADATKAIPFADGDFVLLDPPYWRVAEGKYKHGGETIDEWLDGLLRIAKNCHLAMKSRGIIALVLDDYLRSAQKIPLALLGADMMREAGFIAETTIYNNYTNACASMGPIQQWRAMKAKLMVNGVKIINIFSKT